mgnify:FL=1
MGLHQGTERVAVVVLEPREADIDKVLKELNIHRDDSLLDCSREKGEAFGIDANEMKAAGEEMLVDLVMEKVAFVEILKR